ncbi:YifB family Mg chelatase-like AAA ATPase [Candidatus Wolfebacteria bacterium]|nr:YifB family Mg chelatase-like AAA ATPase [Candidatus Wolfebacteria bacterium]
MKHLAKVYAAELEGIEAKLIEVEVDINVGLHSFAIVGLADRATNEAKERVNSALKNSGVKPPNRENRKITVNLAPADIKKTGSQYDLAIAVGYLLATKQIREFDTGDKIFVGELSLEGSVRAVSGVLNIARLAERAGFAYIFVPKGNAREAALVNGVEVIPVNTIEELICHLEETAVISAQERTEFLPQDNDTRVTIAEIKGQEQAKRALQVGAAGGHHILFSGSPGGGKTMLAQALLSILPPFTMDEALEATQIWSAAGLMKEGPLLAARPFRSPHHTASPVSIVGGGGDPRPGEISLAHNGILFLDEIPEFRRDLLEALRQPLESGTVTVNRVKTTLTFPARFMLVAAMNPCPCGYFGDTEKECRCSANEVFRYQKKISGPLLDRIDIQVEVPRVAVEYLRKKTGDGDYEQLARTKESVCRARNTQDERFLKTEPRIHRNSEMSSRQVDEFVSVDATGEAFLKTVLEKSFVSGRGYYRVLKIARTIADLEGSSHVSGGHLAEAFQYRVREKE